MIVTDSYKKLLKRWPGESTEGLIGRYRLKLVFTFIMMEDGGSKGRIALESDISNVPGQTPQDLALSLSADNLSVVHAPSH